MSKGANAMKSKCLLISLPIVAVALMLAANATAIPIEYVAHLSGPKESPPNDSPGAGFADVTFDLDAHTMRVQVTFSGLVGTTTASHIHSPTAVPFTGTAGVATQVPFFDGFPIGVTSGTYDMTFDTSLDSTYNPDFVTANGGSVDAAEAALAASLAAGTAYLNIHSTVFPGGEIRGFLHVPEGFSTAWAALPFAVLLLAAGVRKSRRKLLRR
jgi:hypothetical protein